MSDTSKKKTVLGRGLGALLKENETADRNSPREKNSGNQAGVVLRIPLEQIEVNPFQPRTTFEEEPLRELSDSIRIHGVIQPITVRKTEADKYQLIAGERRLRASKLAGSKDIPAYVRTASDQESIEIALIENIQREDLNALEIAINYKRLMDECTLTQEQLSSRIGKNRSTVTNFLRLLKLPPDIQAALRDEKITMGHAKALLGLEQLTSLLMAYKEVISKNLSVRQTEELVKSYNPAAGNKRTKENREIKKGNTLPQEIRKWQDEVSSHLSTKVTINRSVNGAGEMVIKFYSNDDLERIVDGLLSK